MDSTAKSPSGSSRILAEEPLTSRCLRIAGRQYGLITRTQLESVGASGGLIATRVGNQRLLRICDGLFALGRPIRTQRAIYMAAVLAAGDGALLTGMSAANHWEMRRHNGPVEVVRPESRKPARFWMNGEGIAHPTQVVVRRSRSLPEIDRTFHHGIPTLNPSRVLMGLAAVFSLDELRKSFLNADLKGLLKESELRSCVARSKGWKGIGNFRSMVQRRHPDMKDVKTLGEGLMIDIFEDFRLGRPKVNRRKGRYFPDFRFPSIDLIIEFDGADSHSGRLAFLEDTHRENDLREEGAQVIRFSWEEVTTRRERVAKLVKQEQTRCAALKGVDPPWLEEIKASRQTLDPPAA